MRNDETPDVLWHYTDAGGLHGILSSGRLRFGDARFLNDRSERVYGQEVVDEIFEDLVATDVADVALAEVGKIVKVTRTEDRLFLCSFSSNPASLGLWQRYSADGFGYCIGFHAKALEWLLDRDGAELRRMVYDRPGQRGLVEEQVRRAADEYRQLMRDREGKHPAAVEAIMSTGHVDWAAFSLKHPLFEDEQEWRFFVVNNGGEEPALDPDDDPSDFVREEFCVRPPYVKPYIELPSKRDESLIDRLPVASILCGPRLDFDLAGPGIRRFLRSKGYEALPVEQSELAKVWR